MEHTIFSTAHGTVTTRDRALGYKTSLNIFKRIQITQGMLSGHNGIKLPISNNDLQNPQIFSN